MNRETSSDIHHSEDSDRSHETNEEVEDDGTHSQKSSGSWPRISATVTHRLLLIAQNTISNNLTASRHPRPHDLKWTRRGPKPTTGIYQLRKPLEVLRLEQSRHQSRSIKNGLSRVSLNAPRLGRRRFIISSSSCHISRSTSIFRSLPKRWVYILMRHLQRLQRENASHGNQKRTRRYSR